jgi:hypothetical protein
LHAMGTARRRKTVGGKSSRRSAGRLSGAIPVRLAPEAVAAIDRWAAGKGLTRSEAIGRLVELGLAGAQRAGARKRKAAKATEMASREIDRLGDPSASDEERQLRKRRLLGGPREFRDLRDRPKTKG